jgi:hypothetical protein
MVTCIQTIRQASSDTEDGREGRTDLQGVINAAIPYSQLDENPSGSFWTPLVGGHTIVLIVLPGTDLVYPFLEEIVNQHSLKPSGFCKALESQEMILLFLKA